MGFNEAAGYVAVAATAAATGYLAESYGLRPALFLLGIAFAALGLGLSTLAVKETRGHARLEAANHVARADGRHDHLHGELSDRQVLHLTSFREPALSSASQAGLVNNLNDGLAWGCSSILFAGAGLSVARIGVLAALYPAVWGVGQLVTGALSDRWGRKWLIAGGMWLQAVALALIAVADAFAVGRGRRPPRRRHRDGLPDPARLHRRRRPPGLAGPVDRDLPALARRRLRRRPARRHRRRRARRPAAVRTVAGLTAVSGLVVAVRMYETHHRPGRKKHRWSRHRRSAVGERGAKDALFAEFAAVGKVLGSPKRLELLDLLAQGPRSVEELAATADSA